MRYLGGKSKIRKELARAIESYRKPDQTYFGPFVGGGWVLQEIKGRRIASDGNAALVNMYRALQAGWMPPVFVSEEEYQAIKKRNDPLDPMTMFVGIGCSFAGKLWGGYARSADKPCYAETSRNSLLRQLPHIKDVTFAHGLYTEHAPKDMLVYCDPPYANTTSYDAFKGFDSNLFWKTMREWSKTNTVLVSEYEAPSDFACIAEFSSQMGMTVNGVRTKRIERLFSCNGLKSNEHPTFF